MLISELPGVALASSLFPFFLFLSFFSLSIFWLCSFPRPRLADGLVLDLAWAGVDGDGGGVEQVGGAAYLIFSTLRSNDRPDQGRQGT